METHEIMKRIGCAAVIMLFLLIGCRTSDPDIDRSVHITLPDRYAQAAEATDADDQWWAALENGELNTLIAGALENSHDLAQIRARVSQAQAAYKKANASLLPDLDYSLGGQKRESKVKTGRDRSSVYSSSHSWDASLTGSFSPDVWGEYEADRQSETAAVQAVNKDLHRARQALAAQVAHLWIDIIAVRNKIEILDRQIETNAVQLTLQELRYANGRADALDVSQQREALAEIRSQVPLLIRQEQMLLNTLAFVSGKPSADGIEIKTAVLPSSGTGMPAGVPSDLLGHRPDIQAARERLSSVLWEVEAAKADLLPSLTLTARALFSSGSLDLLFSNWVATLTAAVTGPIFDGGYKKAEKERLEALAQERLAQYAQAVAGAIREVEDSLVTISTQDHYIRLLEEELELARLTLSDARLQYWNGKSSYLSYLVVLTRIGQLERQLIGEKAAAVKERITLSRALGFSGIVFQARSNSTQ